MIPSEVVDIKYMLIDAYGWGEEEALKAAWAAWESKEGNNKL